jgi:hypothetical protein
MKTTMKFTCPAFAALALVCFAVLSTAQAVTPAPDGGYPGWNTAEGQDALFHLTTGGFNTAIGGHVLYGNTTGSANTAVGAFNLAANSSGYNNVAIGQGALRYNTTGDRNTAAGYQALYNNTGATGRENTAYGVQTLYTNTTGNANIAVGSSVLYSNTTGGGNRAAGFLAMYDNTTGIGNTAMGYKALLNNITGYNNTAIGEWALYNNITGTNNIGVGPYGLGGYDIVTASHVIAIGHPGADVSDSCWIGNIATSAVTGSAVYISSSGQLGLLSSSRRLKKEIKPMDKASEAMLALKPVTFQYKSDRKNTPQFGLIGEDVAEVNPDLVVRDNKGELLSVRYDQVNAMLLNEFLKEHRKVEEQQATITEVKKELQANAARQQKQIEALAVGLQKVSAQLEMTKSAPQVAVDK